MINTRLVMTAAAIFFGLAGAACLFLPDEVLKLYSVDSSSQTAIKDIGGALNEGQTRASAAHILVQILGACFLPMALLDWYSKHNVMGGIYGRPVVATNYIHFVIGSLVLAKVLIGADPSTELRTSEDVCRPQVWLTLAVYVLFAIAFSFMMFGKPRLSQEN